MKTKTGDEKTEVKTEPVTPTVVDRTLKGVPVKTWEKFVERAKAKNTGKLWRYFNDLMDKEEIMDGWISVKMELDAKVNHLLSRIEELEKKPESREVIGFGRKKEV